MIPRIIKGITQHELIDIHIQFGYSKECFTSSKESFQSEKGNTLIEKYGISELKKNRIFGVSALDILCKYMNAIQSIDNQSPFMTFSFGLDGGKTEEEYIRKNRNFNAAFSKPVVIPFIHSLTGAIPSYPSKRNGTKYWISEMLVSESEGKLLRTFEHEISYKNSNNHWIKEYLELHHEALVLSKLGQSSLWASESMFVMLRDIRSMYDIETDKKVNTVFSILK